MKLQNKSSLPPLKDFEEKFRAAFGRELTREERRFYRLVGIVLQESFFTPCQLVMDSGSVSGDAGFIHDFNNLVHVLVGHTELLEGVIGDDPKALSYTLRIKQAATETASLTQHFLRCEPEKR
jgi:hypothetical protein